MKKRREARELQAQLNPRPKARSRYRSTWTGDKERTGIGLPPLWLVVPLLIVAALFYFAHHHTKKRSEEKYDFARQRFVKLLLAGQTSEAMMHLKIALTEKTREEKMIGFREVALSIFRMTARRSDERLVLPPELQRVAEDACSYLLNIVSSSFSSTDERIKLLLEIQDFYDSLGSMKGSAYARAEVAKLLLMKDPDFENQRLMAMLSLRGRLHDDSVGLMEAAIKHAHSAFKFAAKANPSPKDAAQRRKAEATLQGLLTVAEEELQLRKARREAEQSLANGTLQNMLPPPLFANVDRRSDLSYQEFISQYVSRGVPVIITDYGTSRLFTDQPSDQDPWKLITERCGSMNVEVMRLRAEQWDVWARLLPDYNLTRLDTFVSEIEKPDMAGAYVFDRSLTDVGRFGCGALLQNFVLPQYFAQDVLKNRVIEVRHREDPFHGHPSLFVGAANSSSALHIDRFESHFWQALLAGRKRWQLFAIPENWKQRLLYEQAGWGTLPVAPGDSEQRLARYPLARVAAQYQVEFEVLAGEILFIPAGMAHSSWNPEPSIAISMNYVDHTNAAAAAQALAKSPKYGALGKRLGAAKLQAPSEVKDLPWQSLPGRGQRQPKDDSAKAGEMRDKTEL